MGGSRKGAPSWRFVGTHNPNSKPAYNLLRGLTVAGLRELISAVMIGVITTLNRQDSYKAPWGRNEP